MQRCPIVVCLVARASWDPGEEFATLPWSRVTPLTRRQAQLAACLALGLGDRQVAVRLRLTLYTVRSYAKGLYRRLELATRAQVARHVIASLTCCQEPIDPTTAPTSSWAQTFHLPPRLARVAACICHGASDKQIAARLGLRPQSARTYVKQLYRRLGVRSRAEVLIAICGQVRGPATASPSRARKPRVGRSGAPRPASDGERAR